VKALVFYVLCRDNEDPKRDATTAPSSDTRAADEPSVQEVKPVAKSSKTPKASKAPAKKPVATRGSKRLKKSIAAGVSLEIHLSKLLRRCACWSWYFAFVLCVIFVLTCFSDRA
jgi:hypothetical protein